MDIEVTELGCYDEDQDGLARPHRVAIFDARRKRLLARVRVGPGSALDGVFRYELLEEPVVLMRGKRYVVGVETLGTDDPEQPSEVVYEVDPHDEQRWAHEIVFEGLRTNLGSTSTSGGFPVPTDPGEFAGMARAAWMSPNFKYEPTSAASSTAPWLRPQAHPGRLVITNVSEPKHNYDICLVRSDGAGLRRLTRGRGNEERASWSPDGARIVYGATTRQGSRVCIMNADGTGKVVVADGIQPSWSPDGERILYYDGGVCVVNTDGSGRRRVVGFSGGPPAIIEEPSPPAYAAWAPDGSIVFVRVASLEPYGGGDLFTVDADGSGFSRLTRNAGVILPAVSPDGTRVAVYVPKKDHIVSLPLDGDGTPVTLLAEASRYFPNGGRPTASWTEDGRELVLGSSNFGETGGAGLYLVKADGSGLARIPHVRHALCPAWRPVQ